MKQKGLHILLHLTGSIAFLSIPIVFSPDFRDARLFSIRPFQVDLLTYAGMLAFFYLNYFLFIPKLYFTRKYFLFALTIIACFAVLLWLPSLLPDNPMMHRPPAGSPAGLPVMRPPMRGPGNMLFFELRTRLIQFLFPLTLSLLLRLRGRLREVESEKQKAELSYLKAQINPHFLFNSLNSIYSLSIEKSDNTPEAIVKLSGMMRYMLEESDKKMVPLDHEIEYITNYIDLQKLRLGNSVKLEHAVSGETVGYLIVPLMLIPFVENCFKHGVNAEEDPEIRIRIDVRKNVLYFSAWNTKVHIGNKNSKRRGLGVENTRKRLRLAYPGKHELLIEDTKDHYSVSLSISLT